MILTEFVTQNKTAFIARVQSIADELNLNPNWIMAVMYKESRLNHQAVNTFSGATGLIQFMPSTAAAMGTTTAALKAMTNVQQLEFVKAYLKPYANRIRSFVDTYFAVFFPVVIGRPADTILQTNNLSPGIIAAQNPGMDANKDGKITVQEVENWLLRGWTAAQLIELQKKKR
jgi:hypothetical protein